MKLRNVFVFPCFVFIAFLFVATGAQTSFAQEPVVRPLPAEEVLQAHDAQPHDDAQPAAGEEMYLEEDEAYADDGELSEDDRAAYAAMLREKVAAVRGIVEERVSEKLQDKQASNIGRVARVLFLISLGGVLLLFAPLVLRGKYPGKERELAKYGALAALLFFCAVNLFSGVLLLMRGSQAVLGQVSNPQIQLVNATFDMFHEKAPELAEVGPLVIDPVVDAMANGGDSPALVMLLENIQQFREDITVFQSVAGAMKNLDWLFGMVPILLVGIALLVFARSAKETLINIITLPSRGAAGDPGVGAAAVRRTLGSVFQEFKATLVVVVALTLLTITGGVILSRVLIPTVEVFIGYLTVSFLYVQVEEAASSTLIIISLMTAVLFMAINLLIALAASGIYISKVQKISQKRFRDGIPFGSHRRFWRLGTLSLLWCQVLPLLFALVSVEWVGWLAGELFKTESWPIILLGGPGLFLVAFGLVFWLFRGVKAFTTLTGYKVDAASPPVVSEPADTEELPPAYI